MLTSLDISNFKCFKQLKIAPLAKVNLFVGTSNSGKNFGFRGGLNAAGHWGSSWWEY